MKQGATSQFTALYDGDGLRVNKWDLWTGNHDFAWGPGGVITDSNGSGTTYTPGLAHRKGTTDRFYHSDWLGSTRYLSDINGTAFPSQLRYDAFGNRSATAGNDPYHSTDFQFAGAGSGYQQEYADATINEPGLGLQYLEQRYYDPVVARFISPDPIGLNGGLNLYTYGDDDPANEVDPTGEGVRDAFVDWLYRLIMGRGRVTRRPGTPTLGHPYLDPDLPESYEVNQRYIQAGQGACQVIDQFGKGFVGAGVDVATGYAIGSMIHLRALGPT